MRNGIKRILESKGHSVDTAENGTIGIELGTSTEYDIYFIDLKMPDLDGETVLSEIKARYPEAICVVVTAYASIDTAVKTTRLGAYHYIPKPFAPEELDILVERALERRWYILEARRLKKEQEERLLEIAYEKTRLRTIIQALDDGVLVVNNQGEVVLFNPRFLQLLDLHSNLKIGDPVLDVLPVDLSTQLERFLNNGRDLSAIDQEIVVHPPDKLVIMANSTPIRNEAEETVGVVTVLRDITELKRIDTLRAQFVDMAAHELKAPLSAVQGYLEMIVEKQLGDSPEVYEKYMQRSLERTKSLLSLVNDLLNISRMEAGKIRREIQKVDVNRTIAEVIEKLSHEMQSMEIKCSTDFEEHLFLEMDKKDLEKLLAQIIGNAIKYNRRNGTIKIRTSIDGNFAKIAVEDTGIGMKREEQERLFEEFFRAKNEHTRRITGTGLGLTVAKKIVDAYAGKIKVRSEYEQGSTFTIFLPMPETSKQSAVSATNQKGHSHATA